MKHTRRIISLAMVIVMVCSVMAVFSACNKRTVDEPTEPSETTTEEPATFEEPSGEEIPEVTTEDETTTEQNETTTEKKEPVTKKAEPTTARKQEPTTHKKAEPTTKKQEPVTQKKTEPTTKKQEPTTKKQNEPTTKKEEPTTKKVEPTTKESSSGKFTCTSPNHHCTTREEHEFLCSLEAKGCPICGSHSCKSFYAVDEWGNNCYDITRCPKYAEDEDPANCCEYCGRECGLGDNGTCVRFTVDTVCPICGKTVKAKTCHTH